MYKLACIIIVILFLGCNKTQEFVVTEIVNPAKINSGESSLLTDANDNIYLSWIDIEEDTISYLRYAQLDEDHFTDAHTIANGHDWFVNWADFPSLSKFPNSDQLLAHWLQKSANGTYDYDVRISSSVEDATQWNEPQILHNDGVAAEHGFVSITPYQEELLAIWLDGRKMTSGHHDHNTDGHAHGGAMTLRSAKIHADGAITNRILLDDKVCECCQTDVAVTSAGPIVVYRNNDDQGIRDIYYTRSVDGEWIIPKPLYEDKWKISGCPVNGPRIDAKGDDVFAVWYSGSDQTVKACYSSNSGKDFSDPIIISDDNDIGRLDISMISDGQAAIAYYESDEDRASVLIKLIDRDLTVSDPILIGMTSAARSSGFPRITTKNKDLYISYTNVDSTTQRVVTKVLSI